MEVIRGFYIIIWYIKEIINKKYYIIMFYIKRINGSWVINIYRVVLEIGIII